MNAFNNSFRESFISLSTAAKIILLVFIIAVTVLLGGILSVIAASLVYGKDFQELLQILSNPSSQNIHIVKFFQGFQSVALFIIPAFLASFLFSRDSFRYLHISKEPSVVTVLLLSLIHISEPTRRS
jgi:cytosine/uracil/thiamine/allantoin permease